MARRQSAMNLFPEPGLKTAPSKRSSPAGHRLRIKEVWPGWALRSLAHCAEAREKKNSDARERSRQSGAERVLVRDKDQPPPEAGAGCFQRRGVLVEEHFRILAFFDHEKTEPSFQLFWKTVHRKIDIHLL